MMRIPNVQAVCFCVAVLVYALFSSPTPDMIGWAEYAVLLCLLASIRLNTESMYQGAYAGVAYGITVPVIVGIIGGYDPSTMIRDIIPFLFIFLFLMYAWIEKERLYFIPACVSLIGVVFSIRTILAYADRIGMPAMWGNGPPADLLYLANSPEVLFAGLYALGIAVMNPENRFNIMARFSAMIVVMIVCVAMGLMGQRAGLSIMVIFALGYVLYAAIQSPRRGIVVGMVCLGASIPVWPVVADIYQGLAHKTRLVGLNARVEEWRTVWDIVISDLPTTLFGLGWGGTLENPAVGGLRVGFTHSLISYLFLKTGLCGAVVILGVTGSVIARAFYVVTRMKENYSIVLLIAAALPFCVSLTLYASYKSIGFGLILLIFAGLANRNLEKNC